MAHTCPYCGTAFRVGTLYCEDCGRTLPRTEEAITLPARKLQTIAKRLSDRLKRVSQDEPLYLYIRGAKEPLRVTDWNHLTLGRVDRNSPRQPDVDLTTYGALEKGVSRIHAMFERVNAVPMIVDMDSSNGVYINGDRCDPGEAYALLDGDELHLGELIAHVYFGD